MGDHHRMSKAGDAPLQLVTIAVDRREVQLIDHLGKLGIIAGSRSGIMRKLIHASLICLLKEEQLINQIISSPPIEIVDKREITEVQVNGITYQIPQVEAGL